jgi:hypothetical protein
MRSLTSKLHTANVQAMQTTKWTSASEPLAHAQLVAQLPRPTCTPQTPLTGCLHQHVLSCNSRVACCHPSSAHAVFAQPTLLFSNLLSYQEAHTGQQEAERNQQHGALKVEAIRQQSDTCSAHHTRPTLLHVQSLCIQQKPAAKRED